MSSTTTTTRTNQRFIKRPDDSLIKKEIESLNKEIKQLDLSTNEINQKLDKITIDPKVLDLKRTLLDELKELRGKQATTKQERTVIQDQIKLIDSNLKRKINEINVQTSKNNFKSVADIDSRIKYLDSLIDEGSLKLADERRYIKEMSQLRKLRKDFGEVEKQQELIDKDKLKIIELKKKLSSIQNKETQSRYEEIQKQLDEINADNKTIDSQKNTLRSKRLEVKKSKDEKYDRIRKLRADFQVELETFKTKLAEERKKRDEEYKSRIEQEKQEKKKVIAEKKLADASIPAFTNEINQIQSLLTHFDPTYVKPKSDLFKADESVNTNNTIRKVEMPADVVILEKKQTSFIEGSKGKKFKNKKSANKPKPFTVDTDIIASLTDLAIPLPTKSDDVPETIAVLKETLTALQDKQEEQTKVNIENAKAEIAKLEAQEQDEDEEEEEVEEEN